MALCASPAFINLNERRM